MRADHPSLQREWCALVSFWLAGVFALPVLAYVSIFVLSHLVPEWSGPLPVDHLLLASLACLIPACACMAIGLSARYFDLHRRKTPDDGRSSRRL